MASTDLNAKVSMREINRRIIMHVTITHEREHRIRMWVGVKLIKLAGWVMQVHMNITTEAKPCP